MEGVKVQFGGREHTLALDMNATILLAAVGGSDLKGMLSALSAEDVSLHEKLRTVRTIVWALMASEHPEFEEDIPGSLKLVGSWFQPSDIERIMSAATEALSAKTE